MYKISNNFINIFSNFDEIILSNCISLFLTLIVYKFLNTISKRNLKINLNEN